MIDILIKGGHVIDPGQEIYGKMDIAIDDGRISSFNESIPELEAKKVIDARGKIVTPGLIDLHTHVAEETIELGISPDMVGVYSGVTTLCDAGSTGYLNFDSFKQRLLMHRESDIFCFLNICPSGLNPMPENWDYWPPDQYFILKAIEENHRFIKGLKLRVTWNFVENVGLKGIEFAKKTARQTGLPLMVHIGADIGEQPDVGLMNSFSENLLEHLGRGDILSHFYTWKEGGVFDSGGHPLSGLRRAQERGVLFDLAMAKTNFSAEIAMKGLEQGILPHIVSTDITAINIGDTVFSLLVTMSKMLHLGLTLEQLVEMTTITPARILQEQSSRGTLRSGMPADITILEIVTGSFLFSDSVPGKTFKGTQLIQPILCLKNGREIQTESRFPARDIIALNHKRD